MITIETIVKKLLQDIDDHVQEYKEQVAYNEKVINRLQWMNNKLQNRINNHKISKEFILDTFDKILDERE